MSKRLIKKEKKTRNCNITQDKTFDVYCGRGAEGKVPNKVGKFGWLGNPIKISEACCEFNKIHKKAGDTLDCYNTYLERKLENEEFSEEFYKLEGKKLGCFCKPGNCHTDIMIKYLNMEKR